MKRDFEGQVLVACGRVTDTDGNPIAGAELDIWQTAPNGLYSSQDPAQDTYSFHGLQTTDADGRYGFSTVRPVSYTVPTDGPVGEILNATGRHPWRPSHLHYIVKAAGFRPPRTATGIVRTWPEVMCADWPSCMITDRS